MLHDLALIGFKDELKHSRWPSQSHKTKVDLVASRESAQDLGLLGWGSLGTPAAVVEDRLICTTGRLTSQRSAKDFHRGHFIFYKEYLAQQIAPTGLIKSQLQFGTSPIAIQGLTEDTSKKRTTIARNKSCIRGTAGTDENRYQCNSSKFNQCSHGHLSNSLGPAERGNGGFPKHGRLPVRGLQVIYFEYH